MKRAYAVHILSALLLSFAVPRVAAQMDARMLQFPDVSATQIVFSYAGDLWLVPREGGTAIKLSSPKGQETFPRFSPDGRRIAFNAAYHGNTDIYVLPVTGGLPTRVTNHGGSDRLIGWYPDGRHLLFVSAMSSGHSRLAQFFKVPATGGLPEKLPVPYGEFGSLSPDGAKLVYTPQTQAFRTWKRYRGGWAPDIWLFDLSTLAAEKIIESEANDEFPMWHGDRIYFLSDRGAEKRSNIWVYELVTKRTRQITHFTDFDIHWPTIGPMDIVFEAGGRLHLLGLADEKAHEVLVQVVTDHITLLPEIKNVSKLIQHSSLSPDGTSALFEARGEIFSVSARNGVVADLTQTSGSAERYPAYAPDGKRAAYWSDRSGEYELVFSDLDKPFAPQTLTSYGPGYRYHLFWSPNGKKIAFIDKAMEVRVFDVGTKETKIIDNCRTLNHESLEAFRISWSSDGTWLAYAKDLDGRGQAVFLYDVNEGIAHQVTSGFYRDSQPVFDPEGKYLYFLTSRDFSPMFSDFDNSWIYANTTRLALIPLSDETPSPLAPKSDRAESGTDEARDAARSASQTRSPKTKPDNPGKIRITLPGFENRLVLLPPAAGNFLGLSAAAGKILFHRAPNTGSAETAKPLCFYDIEHRQEKKIADDVDSFEVSADGKKILVAQNGSFYIVDNAEGQALNSKLATAELEMVVEPRAEWRQLFNDAWRFERDYFYDPHMHGVDWRASRERYGRLIDDCLTRWDVNYVLGELIGELNSSHTYIDETGDTEEQPSVAVGYLGINWEVANGAYRIKSIVDGAPWDNEVRSPLLAPGLKVKAGDYILAVNGRPLDPHQAPWGPFAGLAGKTVELSISEKPSVAGAKTIVVQTLTSEDRLRALEWIESNRVHVSEATHGRVGYIFVPSTGLGGQSDLFRQFLAQYDKEGLIIDERFNKGGQIPDRFIELLRRKPLSFLATRDGGDRPWPPAAHSGPEVMLINGWSGSGGDALPDYFRALGLGPLIGMRTWGGLIGLSGAPSLIDGGAVSVPTFRLYYPGGGWFKEGHGVEPDISVVDDPSHLAKGLDPQLERAIQEVFKQLKNAPPRHPSRPDFEKR